VVKPGVSEGHVQRPLIVTVTVAETVTPSYPVPFTSANNLPTETKRRADGQHFVEV
jgi:hypothetical protein